MIVDYVIGGLLGGVVFTSVTHLLEVAESRFAKARRQVGLRRQARELADESLAQTGLHRLPYESDDDADRRAAYSRFVGLRYVDIPWGPAPRRVMALPLQPDVDDDVSDADTQPMLRLPPMPKVPTFRAVVELDGIEFTEGRQKP